MNKIAMLHQVFNYVFLFSSTDDPLMLLIMLLAFILGLVKAYLSKATLLDLLSRQTHSK